MSWFRSRSGRSADPPRRRRRRRFRSGDVIILLVAGAVVVAFFNLRISQVVDFIYNPIVGLILLIMIVEFLWLKSGDRTRVYALEIDRLRGQRRRDEELLKRAREVIDQAIEYPESEEKGRPGDWRQRAADIRGDIDHRL